MAIIHLEQKHVNELMKMPLFYKDKTKQRHCKIFLLFFLILFSYLDDVKLFFSTSRYDLLDCYKCG